MVARLKSISRQIHWSLLLKAAVFALAWFFLPFWLFLLIALYLYFIPFFNSRKLFWPFFALVVLTYIEPANPVYLLLFAVLFYYLLLIKDLLLIDRQVAYELLIIALEFFLIRSFYGHFGIMLMTTAAVWYSLLLAMIIGLLVNSMILYVAEGSFLRRPAVWFATILVWQFLLLGLFLPLDFIYQSVVVFLAATLIIDLVPEQVLEPGGVSRQRIMTSGITIGTLVFLVLVSATWGY
jgi:hypothetical protein